jgi:hypothetical protein
MRDIWLVLAVAMLSGCAQTAALPLSNNSVQITTSAAPVCGTAGAQRTAFQNAAIETLRHGYDSFIVTGAQVQDRFGIVGRTPIYAQTNSTATAFGSGDFAFANGSSTTVINGGYPIVAGTHDQVLIVKMFKSGDAGAAQAIPARQQLGPDWKQKVADGSGATCS